MLVVRLRVLEGRQLDEESVPYIQDFSRARLQTEWTRSQIRGYGLVAWKVEEQYQNDPTSILRPVYGACYPETYTVFQCSGMIKSGRGRVVRD